MAVCKQCGAELPEGATKCEFCGAEVVAEEAAPAAAPADDGFDLDLGGDFDLDAEFKESLANEIKQMEDESNLSEDLSAYASGFPAWDLLPPKEKK